MTSKIALLLAGFAGAITATTAPLALELISGSKTLEIPPNCAAILGESVELTDVENRKRYMPRAIITCGVDEAMILENGTVLRIYPPPVKK